MEVRSINDLVEVLESIRTEIHPRRLSPAQYEEVGWADRPLRQLIDQARDEAEMQSWQIKRATDYRRRAVEVKP